MKLNETNYKQWVKSLMMNLTIMKLNLDLKVKAPPKPIVESFAKEKKNPMRTGSILIAVVQ